jgi:hypothetical protein
MANLRINSDWQICYAPLPAGYAGVIAKTIKLIDKVNQFKI